MIRVCFVCLGNICRSPTAEGVMLAAVAREGLENEIEIDSAGTGSWHEGERADRRSREAAKKRGYELPSVARQIKPADFARFDYLVAMDASNAENLRRLAPDATSAAKVSMLRSFDPSAPPDVDVPDPYYGEADGFERVLDICEAGCAGLLAHIRKHHAI